MKRLLAALAILIPAGCSDGDPGEGPSESAKASWALTLKMDGADVRLPLERFYVYLVEDEKTYPEIFEFEGPGVALAGEFPKEIHVGYGEDWSKLFGKTVTLLPRGGDPRDPKECHITVPNSPAMKVLGGSFVAEKLTGKAAGLKGDRTLHGRITLRLSTPLGEKTVEGTFAVQAVTLG
jgi:hypothetical protein